MGTATWGVEPVMIISDPRAHKATVKDISECDLVPQSLYWSFLARRFALKAWRQGLHEIAMSTACILRVCDQRLPSQFVETRTISSYTNINTDHLPYINSICLDNAEDTKTRGTELERKPPSQEVAATRNNTQRNHKSVIIQKTRAMPVQIKP